MTLFPWNAHPSAVLVDGVRLEAAGFGPPPEAAPTLVLLHEGLGCVALWRDFPRALAEATGFGVFAYSRAGYGRSDPTLLPRPLDYMTREARDVLPRVLQTVGVRSFALVGHSDGGTIAAIYAGLAETPGLRGIALLAPHFFAEPEGLGSIRAAATAFRSGDLRRRLARHHDHVDVAFEGWAGAWLDPGFLEWNVADAIDRWRVPALAIQGKDDVYGTRAQIDEIARRARVALEIEMIPNCGHAPQFEAAERTLARIAGFARERLGGTDGMQSDG